MAQKDLGDHLQTGMSIFFIFGISVHIQNLMCNSSQIILKSHDTNLYFSYHCFILTKIFLNLLVLLPVQSLPKMRKFCAAEPMFDLVELS